MKTKQQPKANYLSEILVPNQEWELIKFKIIMGLKNAGKSFYAYTKMKERINNKESILYIRNTQEELDAMSISLLAMLEEEFGKLFGKNKTDIYFKNNNQTVIKLLSAKNYKKISGTILPNCTLMLHDEFNQNNDWNPDFIENIFNGIGTASRNKNFEFIALGNNQRQNNPYFNTFQFDPVKLSDLEPYKFWFDKEVSLGIFMYSNFAFSGNTTLKDNVFDKMLKKYNPEYYDTYYGLGTFNDNTNLVINNLNKIIYANYAQMILAYDNRFFVLMPVILKNEANAFITNLLLQVDEDKLRNKFGDVKVYGLDPKSYVFNKRIKMVNKRNARKIATTIGRLLKQQDLYFNNFNGLALGEMLSEWYYKILQSPKSFSDLFS